MLLGEPPRTQYDLNFSLLRIPVRVDPWFWLMTLILGSQRRDPASILSWIVAVFFAILIHELGHALAMLAYGLRPWIVLYSMGGLTSYDPRDAFRSKGSDWLGQIVISFAGPAAGRRGQRDADHPDVVAHVDPRRHLVDGLADELVGQQGDPDEIGGGAQPMEVSGDGERPEGVELDGLEASVADGEALRQHTALRTQASGRTPGEWRLYTCSRW